MTNHDDFNRDPVNADEVFDAPRADMPDYIDDMVDDRLAGGELDRRLAQIKKRADQPAPDGETVPAPPEVCLSHEPASTAPWDAKLFEPVQLPQLLSGRTTGIPQIAIGTGSSPWPSRQPAASLPSASVPLAASGQPFRTTLANAAISARTRRQRMVIPPRPARAPSSGPQAGLYVSRTSNIASPLSRAPADTRIQRLRDLARQGRLAAVVAAAEGSERRALTAAAYNVVWPIVFARITRRVEQRRGHWNCAAGVDHLADECIDRFHDDVEAVVDDLLTHARQPVLNLEAWITGRLNAATVDGHRRRRGMRGALQRPRLPGWLADDLGHNRWLMALATHILVWVGVSHTAGNELTPAQYRQAHDPRADQFAARLEQLPAVPPEPAPHRFRPPWRARRSGDEA